MKNLGFIFIIEVLGLCVSKAPFILRCIYCRRGEREGVGGSSVLCGGECEGVWRGGRSGSGGVERGGWGGGEGEIKDEGNGEKDCFQPGM